MHLLAKEEASLRAWMNNRLDNLNDIVDCEVLTDFVFTLLRGNGSIEELESEASCCLQDILEDETEQFVKDLFRKLLQLTHREISRIDKRASNWEPNVERHNSRKRRLSHQSDNYVSHYSASQDGGRSALTNIQNRSGLDRVHPDRLRLQNLSHSPPQKSLINPFETPDFLEVPQEHVQKKIRKQNANPPGLSETDNTNYQSGFKAMRHYFPALTQMWLNNAYMQEVLHSKGLDAFVSTEQQDDTVDESKIRCYDYDMTGICIRGDSCSYLHERSHSNINLRKGREDSISDVGNDTKDIRDSTLANPAPKSIPPVSLFMQNVRNRQTHFQKQHNKRKAEVQEYDQKRMDLAQRMRDLEAELEAEKAKLKAKLAEKEDRIKYQRGVETEPISKHEYDELRDVDGFSIHGQPAYH